MNKELEFLIKAVKDASLLINDDFEVSPKGNEGDLVTEFDYKIEKYLIEKIEESYPEFSVISEEYNHSSKLSDNCFTIDPIDGTINFANRLPLWGIQAACIKNAEVCAAVIYLPELDELYYADKDGAFMNDRKIHVNSLDEKSGMYAIEGPEKLADIKRMKQINPHCRDIYCAAVNFAWTACGRLSGVYFAWDNLWDYVPGQYIVKQAGGITYNRGRVHIAANNEAFFKALRRE